MNAKRGVMCIRVDNIERRNNCESEKRKCRGSVRMTVKTYLKAVCGGVNRGKVRDF